MGGKKIAYNDWCLFNVLGAKSEERYEASALPRNYEIHGWTLENPEGKIRLETLSVVIGFWQKHEDIKI